MFQTFIEGGKVMMENFKLPGSSYEELVKIIIAYSSGKVGQGMSLDELSQRTGMGKTGISRNNAFLVQLELILEGKNKAPTDLCLQLGRAYELEVTDELIRIWNEIIDSNEFLGKMLSAIKIRGGMDRSSLISHILYSSGTSSKRTGANAIIDIFKIADLIIEEDGKIKLKKNNVKSDSNSNNLIEEPAQIETTPKVKHDVEIPVSKNVQFNINVNINTTGEDLDEIQEKLIKLIEFIKA
jgi:hypothetical protein